LPTKRYYGYGAFDETREISNLKSLHANAKALGINGPIYLVPFTYKSLTLSNPKWINVVDYLDKKIEDAYKDQGFVDYLYIRDQYGSYGQQTDLAKSIIYIYNKFPTKLTKTFWEHFNTRSTKYKAAIDPKYAATEEFVTKATNAIGVPSTALPKTEPSLSAKALTPVTFEEITYHMPILKYAHSNLNRLILCDKSLDNLLTLVLEADTKLKNSN